MNPDTGELVSPEIFQKMLEPKKSAFVPVPDYLNRAARKKLAGKQTAMVSLNSGGKLSKFAAEKRKAARKASRQSRRKNR